MTGDEEYYLYQKTVEVLINSYWSIVIMCQTGNDSARISDMSYYVSLNHISKNTAVGLYALTQDITGTDMHNSHGKLDENKPKIYCPGVSGIDGVALGFASLNNNNYKCGKNCDCNGTM